ncbi:hypothetical protein LINPERPRIM_LOCUS23277, partial [Linum perenne]
LSGRFSFRYTFKFPPLLTFPDSNASFIFATTSAVSTPAGGRIESTGVWYMIQDSGMVM